ncbi:hypothetical protein [Halanaerobium praevalens]|uniref:hypothetical protein n=1 Tax=Halanaerobium praevalens TaxID=2331 RepID=UPI0005A0FF05|nr:hypothetical protein [Halanaerobium praevalens]
MEAGIIFMILLLIFLITMFILEPIRIDIIALSIPVILMLPIALDAARQLGLNPMAFALGPVQLF